MKTLTRLLPVLLSTSLMAADRPNILWITAEDHGPHLGCYGDAYATTPHLDAFAETALRYTRAISNAPVCAPARTTVISGMYPTATGSQHMRSRVPAPSWMRFFPAYLREAGYYTTNNAKEDYNLTGAEKGWDESSGTAHWKNRPAGAPFFAVFNTNISHESRIRDENPDPLHDPAQAPVPPYHPDLPVVRKEWAQYYDRLTQADAFFAKHLAELEAAGLAEETIVFYWADHGSGMPRGKRYPGWSGLHVPLIIRFPDKWRHLAPADYQPGGTSDRLVGFIDFAPTLLSIAGVDIPGYYQGHAFAGRTPDPAEAYAFGFRGRMDERPDACRSVMDGRYVYIRNFYPHLPHGQYLKYQQQTRTTAEWFRLSQEGKLNAVQSRFWQPHPREELFDLETDPHETRNLAGSVSHQAVLKRMRGALNAHLVRTRDLGFLPEPILERLVEDGQSPAEALKPRLEATPNLGLEVLAERQGQAAILAGLRDPSPLVRYWTLIQLLAPRQPASGPAILEAVTGLLDDFEPTVVIAAAQVAALQATDPEVREKALARLLEFAAYPGQPFFLGIHALHALDYLRQQGLPMPEGVAGLTGPHESVPGVFEVYRPWLLERIGEAP